MNKGTYIISNCSLQEPERYIRAKRPKWVRLLPVAEGIPEADNARCHEGEGANKV